MNLIPEEDEQDSFSSLSSKPSIMKQIKLIDSMSGFGSFGSSEDLNYSDYNTEEHLNHLPYESSLHPDSVRMFRNSKDENPLKQYIRNKPRADSLPVVQKGQDAVDFKINIMIPSFSREREASIPIVGLRSRANLSFGELSKYSSFTNRADSPEKELSDVFLDELRNSDLSSLKSEDSSNIKLLGQSQLEKQVTRSNMEIFATGSVGNQNAEELLLNVLGNPVLSIHNKPSSIWSRFGRSESKFKEKELLSLALNEIQKIDAHYSKTLKINADLKQRISTIENDLESYSDENIILKQDINATRRKVISTQTTEERNKFIIKEDNLQYQIKNFDEETEYLTECLDAERQHFNTVLEETAEREEKYLMKIEDLRSSLLENMSDKIQLQVMSSKYDDILQEIQYHQDLIKVINSNLEIAVEMFGEAQLHFQESREMNESKISVIHTLKSLQDEVDLTLLSDIEFKKAASTDPKSIMPFTRTSGNAPLTPRMIHKRIGI